MGKVSIKRIYEPAADEDGRRILVDRLWPRGVSKVRAALDTWLKAVGPSHELRVWFDHRPERWDEFRRRYALELKTNPAFDALREIAAGDDAVTLLYGARDQAHNEAVALAELLEGRG